MKVHLNQIPAEGLHLAGEESADILQLPPEEGIRQVSPVHYSLDVGVGDDGMWATGELAVDVEVPCVRCLEPFVYPVKVDDVALQIELPPTELVDLTPHLREDILLALPDYPRCDWSGERVCPGQKKVEALQTPPEDRATRSAAVWETLDQIKIPSKQ